MNVHSNNNDESAYIARDQKLEKRMDGRLPWYHPLSIFCTWFGSGLIPKAPGTFGTLAALPFAWVIQNQLGSIGLLIAAAVAFIIGCLASDAYMKRKETGHDPSEIVIDEVAGVWLALSLFPAIPESYVIVFLLFRFFDIWKPLLIAKADRKIGSGFGVMLDDLFAAFYTVLVYWFAVACIASITSYFNAPCGTACDYFMRPFFETIGQFM